MSALRLYDFELDEQCYKVRLLLAMSGIAHEKIAVDMYPGHEESGPELRALNPAATLPILTDGSLVLHGAEAIMLYLANAYAPAWLPGHKGAFGEMAMWLQFAAVQLAPAAAARRGALFGAGGEGPQAARRAFRIMDDHLTLRGLDGEGFDGEVRGRNWFAGEAPSLADLALFPAIALSRDFGVEHEAYAALRRWMRCVRTLPGFITMPGVPDYC